MNKDIVNYNNAGQLHGYQERYVDETFNTVFFRGCFLNSIQYGYQEMIFDASTRVTYYIR